MKLFCRSKRETMTFYRTLGENMSKQVFIIALLVNFVRWTEAYENSSLSKVDLMNDDYTPWSSLLEEATLGSVFYN